MIRSEIKELVSMGPFPESHDVNLETIKRQGDLVEAIRRPVTDDEARALIHLFGADDYFGLAWTVLHLIETAPGWPLCDCLANEENEWITLLREKARRTRKI